MALKTGPRAMERRYFSKTSFARDNSFFLESVLKD